MPVIERLRMMLGRRYSRIVRELVTLIISNYIVQYQVHKHDTHSCLCLMAYGLFF